MHIRSLILLFIFTCCGYQLSAKSEGVRVVVDTKTHLSGLKDTADNWVVKAAFDRIEESSWSSEKNCPRFYIGTSKEEQTVFDGWSGKKIFGPVKGTLHYSEPGWRIYQNDLVGYVSSKGVLIFKPEYEQLYMLSMRLILKKNNKTGLADTNGKLLAPFIFDNINLVRSGLFLVSRTVNGESLSGILDTSGRTLLHAEYNNICVLGKKVFGARKNQGWHFVASGDKEISPAFDSIYTRYGDSVFYIQQNNFTGLADISGRLRLPPVFDAVYNDGPGRSLVTEKDGKFGLASFTGKELQKPVFDLIPRFGYDFGQTNPAEHERVVVPQNGKFGLLDYSGKMIMPAQYIAAQWDGDPEKGRTGTFIAYDGKKILLFDISEKEVEKIPFSSRYSGNNVSIACGGWTMNCDSLGLVRGKPLPYIIEQQEGSSLYRVISRDGKQGLADSSGKIIVKPAFVRIGQFGYFCFSHYYEEQDKGLGKEMIYAETPGGKFGLFNASGKKIADTLYNSASQLDEENNIIYLGRDNGVTLIDTNGKIILRLDSSAVPESEHEHILTFRQNNGCVFYSIRKRKITGRSPYPNAEYMDEGCYRISNPSGKFGLIDTTGKYILPVIYDQISLAGTNCIAARTGNKTGFYDSEGKAYLKPTALTYSKKMVARCLPVLLTDTAFTDLDQNKIRLVTNFMIDTIVRKLDLFADEEVDYPEQTLPKIIYPGNENYYSDDEGYFEDNWVNQSRVYSLDNHFFCFEELEERSGRGYYDEKLTRSNYYFRNDSLIPFEIQDAFKDDSYIPFLNKKIRETIEEAGSTANPSDDEIYHMFSYAFKKDALELEIFNDENSDEIYSDEHPEFEISIPYTDLKSYIDKKGPLNWVLK